jgi:putative hydrolase of the HAD superfamily
VLRAVCLDVDDTLVDFSTASRGSLEAMIGRGDMWLVWEQITERHVAMVVDGELDYPSMHRQRTKAFLDELGVVVDDAEAARFERRRAAAMRSQFRLFDDVLPCLTWLRQAGLQVAAVTNASGPHQRTKLDELGLSRYIDHVAIAGEVGAAKPDPLIFHSACAALDCEPQQALHVGDRLRTDALGARDAGLRGIWLNRDNHPAELPHGVQSLASLDELPDLLACAFASAVVPAPR